MNKSVLNSFLYGYHLYTEHQRKEETFKVVNGRMRAAFRNILDSYLNKGEVDLSTLLFRRTPRLLVFYK